MTVIIREATPADAEELIAHVKRLLGEAEKTSPLAPEEFTLSVEEECEVLAEYAGNPRAVFLVAEAEGRLVGELNCKAGKREALQHAVVLGMSVRAEWRNRGVGSRLMEAVIEWAQGTGTVKRIELYVYAHNQAAIHLYQKFGFEIEGRRRKAIYQDGRYFGRPNHGAAMVNGTE